MNPLNRWKKRLLSSLPAQKRLYFIHRMDKESTAYNMPMSIPMPPDFDLVHHKQEFENAVKQLIQRHESLRSFS